MQIIYTCPKCGADLEEIVLASNPPQHQKRCRSCGWEHTEREDVVRIPYSVPNINTNLTNSQLNSIPEACKGCSNHPSNGGSGICFCTLGTPELKC